jgi:predicted site-specific integrase-resolvase
MDYVIGNLGLNSQFKATVNEPVSIYASDFDNNGSLDAVLCSYLNGKNYPIYSKDDLASQVTAMETYCLNKGIAVDEWVEEIAGGMNFKRKKFLSIISRIYKGEINYLLVAHKDRLARFGFDLIQFIADENGCKIEVINQESLSPQQEMVEDLLAIVQTFSCRLYGLRKYKKTLKKVLSNE